MPQPGELYAAGCAYWSDGVGQPEKLPVSYWNQSTDSVTGMTGTSVSMTFSSWSTIRCGVAAPGVAPSPLISASVAGLLYRSKFEPAAVPIFAELAEYSHCRSSKYGVGPPVSLP